MKRGDLLRFIILVGFYTGLRRADLLSLRRSQLHPVGMPVPQSKRRGDEVLVRVPQWVVQEIDERYPPAFVQLFPGCSCQAWFSMWWNRLLTEAGLPTGKREGLQKLRRTSVTHAEAAQRGAGSVMAGHENGRTTHRFYIDPRIAGHNVPDMPDLRSDSDEPTTVKFKQRG
ncbi:MAG: site-specific integrase [Planctomycetales bacterium]|nr:site-specific integrase [Planctomycetales bacterium]